MPETAENVAEEFQISRADQDAFAYRLQQRATKAAVQAAGFFEREIVAAGDPLGGKGNVTVSRDEHPPARRHEQCRKTWAKLRTPFASRASTVHRGNASGVNDGAAALIIASEDGGQAPRPDAARPRGRDGHRRRAATHHGHGAGAGNREVSRSPASA